MVVYVGFFGFVLKDFLDICSIRFWFEVVIELLCVGEVRIFVFGL